VGADRLCDVRFRYFHDILEIEIFVIYCFSCKLS